MLSVSEYSANSAGPVCTSPDVAAATGQPLNCSLVSKRRSDCVFPFSTGAAPTVDRVLCVYAGLNLELERFYSNGKPTDYEKSCGLLRAQRDDRV